MSKLTNYLEKIGVRQRVTKKSNLSVTQGSEMSSIDDAIISEQLARYGDKTITRHAAHVFSQNYEDAIIADIFSRIGATSRTFIEIGIGTGQECNTRLLLAQGWSGLWVECDKSGAAAIRHTFRRELASGQLKLVEDFVYPHNVNEIFASAGLGHEVDFLSVDTDMHTHSIWQASTVKARVACIEYNASFPPCSDISVPFSKESAWCGSNWYGASLKTLEKIGREKSLALVGCDTHGVNAFFVPESELEGKFITPNDAETHFQPSRSDNIRVRGHWRHRLAERADDIR